MVALVRAVFGFLRWCASIGDTNVDFSRHIRSSYVIWLSAFYMLNGFWLGSSFMHPSLHFTVCMSRSTSPIGWWLLAGAYTLFKLCLAQNCWNLLPFRQRAWSILRMRGTPCCTIYLFKKFSIIGPFALLYSLSVGNFEKRSMQARK